MTDFAESIGSKTAIAGIGATEFSKDSGRSEWRLAVEAVAAALEDAGIDPTEVDGLVSYSMENNPEIAIAQALGFGELTFFSRIHYGGGAACATIQQAAMAVASGIAKVVVCYRAFNERSGVRLGSGVMAEMAPPTTSRFASAGWLRMACARQPDGRHCLHSATCIVTAQRRRLSAESPYQRAGMPPPIPRRASLVARSRSPIIKHRAGSRSRSGCWTSARKPTGDRHWSLLRSSGRGILSTLPRSSSQLRKARRLSNIR